MPRFFVDGARISDGTVRISGADAFHISRSLRMAAGEHITVCDMKETEYDCVLESFGDEVTARILSSGRISTEPRFIATVWQALPKGDKLDSIIQKAVECGAASVRLFESSHCIAHATAESERKKSERRSRIAYEAAKQCGRGIIPEVGETVSFGEMLKEASATDIPIFCYEGTNTRPLGVHVRNYIQSDKGKEIRLPTVAIIIGPEGGFSPEEARAAADAGMLMTGLGGRILRTETAASFVLAALVYETELC